MARKAQEYAECLSWVLGFAKAAEWEPECRALLAEMQQRFSFEAKQQAEPKTGTAGRYFDPGPTIPDMHSQDGRCRNRADDGRRCNKDSGHKDDHSFWPRAEKDSSA